jgi:hypothetical protein
MAQEHRRNGQGSEDGVGATGAATIGASAAGAVAGKRSLVESALGSGAEGAAPIQMQTNGNAAAPGAAAADGAAAAAAADTRVLSGSSWCAQYPTGTTIAEITDETFRTNVQAFHDAMVAAATAENALSISISASFRPVERAHLMHYAFRVHNGTTTPAAANTASAAAGININWDHGNLATSKAKAGEMVTTYDIAYAPALNSRHTEGKAIDWTITWTGSLMIAKKDETTKLDCTGSGSTSKNLHKVGASYGVQKLASDPPHWSTDGA